MASARASGSAYDGYARRLAPAPDPEFTPVGPGTACGEYLRRFWQPIAFTRDLDGPPRRVRILGEDLVVFRDRSARTGVLHLHCAHRGTSLEFGIPLERGLRCCYHGWVFDVDGRCLETPGEPAGSRLCERVWQGAYPTHEFCGLVFAYMGPPDRRPAFPLYDSFEVPGHTLMPAALFTLPCHWLQVKDNSMDPVHTSFLHAISSGYQFTEAFGALVDGLESGQTSHMVQSVRVLLANCADHPNDGLMNALYHHGLNWQRHYEHELWLEQKFADKWPDGKPGKPDKAEKLHGNPHNVEGATSSGHGHGNGHIEGS